MATHRWIKFWPQDFENDPALKMCSMAAQGLWMRMICRMHEGTPYGHLTIGERPVPLEKLALLVNLPVTELSCLLAELRENGVFSETTDGVIYSRRMVRDNEIAEAGRAAANWGWDQKRKSNGRAKGDPNGVPLAFPKGAPDTLYSESESECASHSAPPRKTAENDRGSRLREDWRPSSTDQEYAARLGLDVARVAEDFRGYWCAKPGKDGRKANWSLTWQNWCRREVDKRGARSPGFVPGDARSTMASFL